MKELTIEITNHCSLSCLFCSTQASKEGSIFVSPERVSTILDEYPSFESVRISGGEPFENPKLKQIVEAVRNKDRRCQILSCGVKYDHEIPEKDFQDISSILERIVFSYHGFYTEHEEIVKPEVPFVQRLAYWDLMMDSVDNAYSADIPVSFQTVVLKQNYSQLEGIVKTLAGLKRVMPKLGGWHLLRFVPQGRGSLNEDQALSTDQTRNLTASVARWRNEYPHMQISYTHAFDMQKCDCGNEKAVVTVTGEKIPCSALKYQTYTGGKFPCMRK